MKNLPKNDSEISLRIDDIVSDIEQALMSLDYGDTSACFLAIASKLVEIAAFETVRSSNAFGPTELILISARLDKILESPSFSKCIAKQTCNTVQPNRHHYQGAIEQGVL